MKYLGNIDLEKPLTLNGKPHGIENITALPMWSATDEGRVVYISSTSKLYIGKSNAWEELTEGNVGSHNHDELYFTETELTNGALDVRYYTEDEADDKLDGKADILHDHSALYAGITHNNTSHSETYITSSGVTYEALNANGDVGSGIGQIASGDHNHDLVYAAIAHDHNSVYSLEGHNHDLVYAAIVHDHNTSYAAIVHDHNSVYSVLSHNHDLAYATIGHNHDTSYAAIVHNHDEQYFTETEVTLALSGKADTGHNHDASYAAVDHNHDGHYTPFATEVSGMPVDTPTIGTLRLDSDGTKLYVYTSTGWKTATLA